MNLHTLPRQSRRNLALGLLAGALLLVGGVAWLFLSAFVLDLDAKAGTVKSKVASINAVANSVSQLRTSWARLERDPRLSVDMFSPASDAQASASVQASAQKLFVRAGATVRSIQTLDVVQEGPIRRVGVRIAVTGTSNQVNRALEAVSHARPVLIVRTGTVQLMGNSRTSANESVTPQLQATFDIFAFARNG